MQKKGDHEDEVFIDAEDGEEIAPEESELSASLLAQKLKTLRTELAECKKERDQNLDGWQRAKADLVNLRRTTDGESVRTRARATAALAREVLPALDSFDMAMQAPDWKDVSETWRTGVERIADQLRGAFTRAGLESYGETGEPFDPYLHECMSVQPTDVETEDHTIMQVLQRGYKLGEEVVRPAKVVVAQYAAAPPE